MESKIEALLEEKFNESDFNDCFVVDIAISKGNRIGVFVDSDSGMTFSKCKQLSRYLEGFIDEEKWFGEKYILEVSSPGIDRPLKFVRQYRKNIGRKISVKLADGTATEGVLTTVTETDFTISQKIRVKEGKKKVTKTEEQTIPFKQTQETKVKITFK